MEKLPIIGVIAFSLLAGLLWLMATIVWVSDKTTDKPDASGMYPARIIDTDAGIDILATASRQIWWNRLAAAATCGAAFCQAALGYFFGKL
jgi:hypothetical protein